MRKATKFLSLFNFSFLILFSLHAIASPNKFTYQGRITNSSDGSAYLGTAQFRFSILAESPSSCVLYKETIANINLAPSLGVFNVTFGDGTADYKSVEATTIHDIFKNSGSLTCENTTTYSPSANASRWLKVEFFDGTSWNALDQNLAVNSVPFASSSMDSTKLGGQAASSYMQKPGAACASGVMGFDGTSLTCTPISSLAVDWTALTGKPTTFAPSAHTHEVDAIVSAAGKYFTYQPNNTACATNDVLKWDGTRWICGTDNSGAGSAITDLTGDVTASGTGSVAATVANVGGKTAAQVATAVDDIAAVPATYLAKAGGTMTGAIDMNQQNLTNAGHITMYPSKTLHLSNNASSPAGSYTGADSGKVWYNSVSNKLEYWNGSVVKIVGEENGAANTAADITSITGTGLVQRTGAASYSTLGVGSDFVITGGITLDLTNSGVTAGTFTKVTVDAKGRVTTGASLSASDIPNLDAAKITTGQFGDSQISAVAVDKISSGAGKYFTYAPNNVACANGEILKKTANGWECAADATGGSPSDSSYAAKGIVQFDTNAATSGISVASGVASVNAGTAANQIVKLDGTAKLPAVDGSALTNITTSVDKITSAASAYFSYKPNNVECADGEFLKWTAATDRWECGSAGGSGTVTSVTAGTGLTGGTITGSGTIGLGTELTGVNSLASTGFVQRTGAGAYSTTAGNVAASNNTLVTRDGSGVSGFYGVGVQGSTAGTATIQAPVSFTNYSLTLPSDDGASGQVLQTNGSGVLSWVAQSSGADNLGNHTATANIQLGSNWLSGDGGNEGIYVAADGKVGFGTSSPGTDIHILKTADNSELVAETSSGSSFARLGVATSNSLIDILAYGPTYGGTDTGSGLSRSDMTKVYSYGSSLVFQSVQNAPVVFTGNSTEWLRIVSGGNVGIGTSAPGSKLDVKGALRLSGSTSGYAGFQPAAAAGSTVWTLPTADGSNGQVLTTNGTGILSWSTPSSTPADASYAAKGIVQFDTNAATSGITVASGVASVNAGTAANQIVKLDGTAKLPAVDGSALTNVTTSVDKITSAASAYFSYKPNNVECTDGQSLIWTAATDRWECGTPALTTELAAVNGLSTTGYVQRTGAGAYSTTAGNTAASNNSLVLRNGSGVSGFYGVDITGSTAGTASLRSPASFTNYVLTLPADDGTSGQVLVTDGSGVLSWQSKGDDLGNHTATTNLILGTNWLSGDGGNEGLRVDTSGNVGVGGAPVANSKLNVTGSVATTTNIVATGNAVDLSLSNLHILQAVGGSTIALSNLVNGGVHTIIVSDTTVRTYTFSGCTNAYFSPANSATTGSSRTIYGITTVYVGASWDCYITWTSGFQ